ncbi:hypothetical protein [Succinivibrio dextrinosolvens]|uniref:hypothetical protein n=1 Tax=Succinivibrio dextrinosolvens TaxID=83771 RepID=UPI0019220D6D|nr:hypothetical protein [Succinivibrio dextrinosolvens]
MNSYNKLFVAVLSCLPMFLASQSFADSLKLAPKNPVSVADDSMPKNSADGEPEYLSLPDDDPVPLKDDETPMFVDNDGKSLDFMEGNWRFNRPINDSKGGNVDLGFELDKDGNGFAKAVNDKGDKFKAPVTSSKDGNNLNLDTGVFKDKNGKLAYDKANFKCDLNSGKPLCSINDNKEKNLQLVAADDDTANKAKEIDQKNKKDPSQSAKSDAPLKEEANKPNDGDGQEEYLSLPDSPLNKLGKGDVPLTVPEDKNSDKNFADGKWKFDKPFVDSKGNPVQTEFELKDGEGKATATGADNSKAEAPIKGTFKDGALKMQVGDFKDKDGNIKYPSMFVECRNVGESAVCKGTDGWNKWRNEQMLAADDKAKNNAEESKKDNEKLAQQQAENEKNASKDGGDKNTNGNSSNNDDKLFEHDPSEEKDSKFSELDAGAPLPPALTEDTTVAKSSKDSPLMGNWRYSQDLSRKSDGSGLGLEFHFDKDGKGYSLIKDDVNGDSKADAEITTLPNGNYRVKTGEYKGAKGYYPTFMECAGEQGKELKCDVSNGWVRLEGGALLNLDEINKKENKYDQNKYSKASEHSQQGVDTRENMEDFLAELNDSDSANSSSFADSGSASASTEDMLADLGSEDSSSQSSSSSSSSSTNKANSTNRSSSTSKASSSSASKTSSKNTSENRSKVLDLPKEENSDMSFLEGKWRCTADLTDDKGNPIIVEFSFNKNGAGQSTVIDKNKNNFVGSARAAYQNKRLKIQTSEHYSKSTHNRFSGQYIECLQKNQRAVCAGKNSDSGVLWQDANFIRIK